LLLLLPLLLFPLLPLLLLHAGAFYLGYGVAHVPSTCVTMQLGARWWYGCMTISWGIVATAAAAIKDRTGLVVQRFLLGVAEAGKSNSICKATCSVSSWLDFESDPGSWAA
jgi:NAD/NADP transhydrogenase alpha subunit